MFLSLAGGSPVTHMQLGGMFSFWLFFTVIAFIGAVDGLKFRLVQIPQRYGFSPITVRGRWAQVVGWFCVLFVGAAVADLIFDYGTLLRRYCGMDTGCLVATPVTGLFAHWLLVIINATTLFIVIVWVWSRRGEVADSTRPGGRYEYRRKWRP